MRVRENAGKRHGADPSPRTGRIAPWEAITAAAVLSASFTWFAASPGAASYAGAPVAVGLAVMLLFFAGRRRGKRGNRLLQAIPVIGWITMPAWLGPVVEATGPTIAAILPYGMLRGLTTSNAVFFVESVIMATVVTAAMGAAYLAATGSWRIVAIGALSSLSVLVVCWALGHAQPSEATRDLVVLGLALTAPVAPISWWLLAAPATPAARRCRACGYDLAGLVSPTCPECGDSWFIS
ncbi:MAG: hypothetical protein KF787_05900 [Phycisphaeraceae bacterium]|nr:hypothetical protein [Phycisphaeraceae bacterium]HRJ50837.1 hypothetical protein [Phycisphaerales bacterium]